MEIKKLNSVIDIITCPNCNNKFAHEHDNSIIKCLCCYKLLSY